MIRAHASGGQTSCGRAKYARPALVGPRSRLVIGRLSLDLRVPVLAKRFQFALSRMEAARPRGGDSPRRRHHQERFVRTTVPSPRWIVDGAAGRTGRRGRHSEGVNDNSPVEPTERSTVQPYSSDPPEWMTDSPKDPRHMGLVETPVVAALSLNNHVVKHPSKRSTHHATGLRRLGTEGACTQILVVAGQVGRVLASCHC